MSPSHTFASMFQYARTQRPFSLSSIVILIGKSHLLFVRKRLFHETGNKCKSWLPLQDVEVSARVVRQQIRVENTEFIQMLDEVVCASCVPEACLEELTI